MRIAKNCYNIVIIMKRMNKRHLLILALLSILSIVLVYSPVDAKVTGNCANCHTMHNNQNGTAMATYGADGKPWKGTGPFNLLVRGDCLGCHGIGPTKTVTIGGSVIPQVYHTDASDLAGGNFRYLDTNDNRGHNVKDYGNEEDLAAMFPPRGFPRTPSNHVTLYLSKSNFACAGYHGCHGNRIALQLQWQTAIDF